jgi:H+/Cl- antiporter ClcA
MSEPEGEREQEAGRLPELEQVYKLLQEDAATILSDLLRGISLWGITGGVAVFMALVSLALARSILIFAHPYGSPPDILYSLYISYLVAGIFAAIAGVFFWRYFTLGRKYSKFFEIAKKLH